MCERIKSCKMKEKVWSKKTLSLIVIPYNIYRLRIKESVVDVLFGDRKSVV